MKKRNYKISKFIAVIPTLLMMILAVGMKAYAVDVGAITKPIDIIKTVLIAVVVGIGTIVLILGVVDLVTSWGEHNTGGLKTAAFKIAAGGLLVGISTLLALMGY